MKGFDRKNLLFSLCGLNCGLCTMHIDHYCPGCGGGLGNQSCAFAKCSLSHGNVEYCFLCSEYPCERYKGIEEYDSFITHQHQCKDMEKAREIGLETYAKEQNRKVEILKILIAKYNDGRRKTFYCLAVNLLPLQELEKVFDGIARDSLFSQLTVLQQAKYLNDQFQEIAKQHDVELKLHKKR